MVVSCCLCEEKFASFKCLRRHISNYHDLAGINAFDCKLNGCYRSFASLKQFFRHNTREHAYLQVDFKNHTSVPESKDDQPDEAEMLSCSTEIMTSSQMEEEEDLAPNAFDVNELKY